MSNLIDTLEQKTSYRKTHSGSHLQCILFLLLVMYVFTGCRSLHLPKIYNVTFDERGTPDVHISLASNDTILLKVQQNEFINGARTNADFVEEDFDNDITAKNVEIVFPDGSIIQPLAVHRKSRIADSLKKTNNFILDHNFYIELPRSLSTTSNYTVRFKAGNLEDITFKPEDSVSLAIHHSRVYDIDSSVKRAKLSTWTGSSGGGLDYQEGTKFYIRNNATDEIVHTGVVALNSAEDTFAGTDVFDIDFSAVTQTGSYQLEVDGIGKSLPFEIRDGVWISLLDLSLEGLYVHRAFSKLEAPYTDFSRPANNDIVFYQSSVSEADFTFFDAGKEFEVLPETADRSKPIKLEGGWFDAGDYDTKVEHISIIISLVDLYNSNPKFYQSFDPNIPESGDHIPDILNEALWGMELYKNLQQPDGGVSGGFEFDSHPQGTASWEEVEAFIYAPDFYASYRFASAAAKLATALESYDEVQAVDLRDRAIRAMEWAEVEYAQLPSKFNKSHKAKDARQSAAVELYRLTKEEKYHDIFISIKDKRNYEASFVYAQLNSTVYSSIDADWQQTLESKLIEHGDKLVSYGNQNGFDTINDPKHNQNWGFNTVITTQNAHYIAMAHQLTGDSKYLDALAASMQFGLGMNPDNMAFTTGTVERGLAYDEPDAVLHADGARLDNIPDGITIYGFFANPWFAWSTVNNRTENTIFNTNTKQLETPLLEVFNDYHNLVPITEYTTHQTIEDQVFAYGYLAGQANNSSQPNPSDPPTEPEPNPSDPPSEPEPNPSDPPSEPEPNPSDPPSEPEPNPSGGERVTIHAADHRFGTGDDSFAVHITDREGNPSGQNQQYSKQENKFILDQVYWGDLKISGLAADGSRGVIKSTHDLIGIKSYSYAPEYFDNGYDNFINHLPSEGGSETLILEFPQPVSNIYLTLIGLKTTDEQARFQAFDNSDNLITTSVVSLDNGTLVPHFDRDGRGKNNTYQFELSFPDIVRLELSALEDSDYSVVGISYEHI